MPKRASPKKKSVKKSAKPKQSINPKQIPSVIQLSKKALEILWLNRKFYIKLILLYGFISLILVQGLASSSSIASLKSQLHDMFNGNIASIGSGLSVFAVLLGTSGNSGQTGSSYQFVLVIIMSLAIIWSLRQFMLGRQILIRNAFYQGMYPLIPFILILLLIGIELLPMLLGSALYSAVVSGSIAKGFIEQAIFLIIFLLLTLWSLYLITVSLLALYIVTLDNMTPIKALRTAKELAKNKRWTLIRKILYVPIAIILASSIIMIPFILWLTFLAPWLFFLLTLTSLVVIHAYMFTLYREMLDEA